jgi:ABC-type multidrug transport system fused ATPase/permease subunit
MPRNPYINLLATAWRYARGEKKDYVRVYFSFMLSNLTDACHPLLYGWMINGVQQYGTAVWRYAWQYGLAYLGLKLLEWFFHGPARTGTQAGI